MRPLLTFLAVSALAVGLTGCASDARPITDSPSTTPTTTSTPDASSTPTPATDNGSPIGLSCEQLVSDQAVYDWGNGNFAADPNFAPIAGSAAADAAAAGGLACGWVNLTSGETVTISAADLSADALAAVSADLAASSAASTTLGDGGYFVASGGIGHADVVHGSIWVSAESALFGEAADAEPLVSAAMSALG